MRETTINGLDSRFIERWSPRAFLSDAIPDSDILTIFEAARWSPSCFNAQPWRFVYATDDEHRTALLDALVESNRDWAQRAPLIAYAFSYNVFDHNGKANRWAAFDTGAAWMSLTLQANQLGYHTHAMGGFDEARAFEVCDIDPNTHSALCALVIGKIGPADLLDEASQERETPSSRQDLETILFRR
jgi:nitroreductase